MAKKSLSKGARDNRRIDERARPVMDQYGLRRRAIQALQAEQDGLLPRHTAGDRFHDLEALGGGGKKGRIIGMKDRTHGVDLGMGQ